MQSVYTEVLSSVTISLFLHHSTTLAHQEAKVCTEVWSMADNNLFLYLQECTKEMAL